MDAAAERARVRQFRGILLGICQVIVAAAVVIQMQLGGLGCHQCDMAAYARTFDGYLLLAAVTVASSAAASIALARWSRIALFIPLAGLVLLAVGGVAALTVIGTILNAVSPLG